MPPPPKVILARARRGGQAAVNFARGYRFAHNLPQPTGPTSEADRTQLETYFDAHTDGPGLWKWRHYFPIYERHLARFKDRPFVFVEIGVFGGGSIAMWRDYFGPGCQIHGVDIDPGASEHTADGVTIHIGDQADPGFWRRFLAEVPAVDVVLDDGGHEAHQQIATFEALFPRVRPGGVYLCEDIHRPSHEFHAYIDGVTRPIHSIGLSHGDNRLPANAAQRHIESVHTYPLLTVIEKPAGRVDYFEAPRHGTGWPD